MSLDTVLQEFETINNDTDVILVTIRSAVDNEGIDDVAEVLLQPQHEELVQEIAWDLLSMIAPYLTSSTNSNTLDLISYIAKVGRPKEMCIAFLEVFETTDSIEIAKILLNPLKTVIDNVSSNKLLLSSTLTNIRRFLQKHCTTIKSKQEVTPSNNTIVTSDKEGEEEESAAAVQLPTNDVNVVSFILSCLCLLDSPLNFIDDYYCRNNGVVPYIGWTDLQKVCIGILTDLLETAMVCNGRSQQDEESVTVKILEYVKLCHCDGVKLLEWEQITRRRRLTDRDDYEEDDDDDESFVLSLEGIAILSCLLLNETCSYLPVVLTHQYRLHVGLIHISQMLELYVLSNHKLTTMALTLSESLLQRISNNSLSKTVLHNSIYKRFLLLLCNTMTSSPITAIRQQAVSLLHPFINCFVSQGRYKLYNILLREVDHAGIKGVLIPRIKDEVNGVLIQQSAETVSSCFSGEELRGLYRQFLVVPDNPDILTEYDRYISGLNFVRFLLLKDSPTFNKTLIWSEKQHLQDSFLKPLRSAITGTQIYCKSLIDNPNEIKKQRQLHDDNLNVDVQILGENPQAPEISMDEEIKLLQRSLLRLDIMTSVLSRVEELF